VTVARTVSDRLRYRYVDDEVIERAGEWAEPAPGFVGGVEVRRPLIDRMLGRVAAPGSAPVASASAAGRTLPGDEELRGLIKAVLSSMAGAGSVVIVSHAASFALGGSDVLRVLVTASAETRAQRLAAERKLDHRAAQRLVKEEDLGRARYLKQFYGVKRELPTHFDVVVNTDTLAPERAGELIVAAAG
jgi:hypothetical protein